MSLARLETHLSLQTDRFKPLFSSNYSHLCVDVKRNCHSRVRVSKQNHRRATFVVDDIEVSLQFYKTVFYLISYRALEAAAVCRVNSTPEPDGPPALTSSSPLTLSLSTKATNYFYNQRRRRRRQQLLARSPAQSIHRHHCI